MPTLHAIPASGRLDCPDCGYTLRQLGGGWAACPICAEARLAARFGRHDWNRDRATTPSPNAVAGLLTAADARDRATLDAHRDACTNPRCACRRADPDRVSTA